VAIWSEATLLRVAELVEQGMSTAQIGRLLGLAYTDAKRYVELVERRVVVPYVVVPRPVRG